MADGGTDRIALRISQEQGLLIAPEQRVGRALGHAGRELVHIGDEQAFAALLRGSDRDRDQRQFRRPAYLAAHAPDTDRQKHHCAAEKHHQSSKDGEGDGPVPELFKAQCQRGEFGAIGGDDEFGHVVAGMDIDKEEMRLRLVSSALIGIGKLCLAFGHHALSRGALAVADVSVLQHDRVAADLIVAPKARPLPPDDKTSEHEDDRHEPEEAAR
ncbi:hypothetical protein D3C73_855900 [compost metagenome]